MKKTIPNLIILFALVLAACSGGGQAVQPTQDINPLLDDARTKAAQTVIAELASQPTATQPPPTPTEQPTATEQPASPTPESSPTPQFTLAPLATATSPVTTPIIVNTPTSSQYNCTITKTIPAYETVFPKRADFDAKWTIKNTGSEKWDNKDVDIRYISGVKMQKYDNNYDLEADVDPGKSFTFVVDMLGPAESGTYTTTWGLVRNGQTFCTFSITIKVKTDS